MPNDRKTSSSETSGFQLRPEGDPQPPMTDESSGPAAESELPHSYGEDVIFLIAQEPHWLFTYWDIDIAKHPGGPTALRCCLADGTVEQEIEVPFETRNWYIPVKQAGSAYFVEIGYHRASAWNVIARSVTVQTPPEQLSNSEDFDFATIPLHLSFQRLAENIQSVVKSGENLMAAVSRMQRSGDFSGFGGQVPSLVTLRQREVLLSLLGADLVDDLASGGLDSSELHSRVQARLEELLSSASASEALAALELLTSAGGDSSGWRAHMESDLSSWSPVQTASWAAGWITSWAAAAPSSWNESTHSSWGAAPAGGASSGGASWGAGAGGATSWSHGALTSWLSAASSSGGVAGWEASSGSLASLTSWLAGIQSSWASAALSAGPQSASWFSAAETSSWGGSSGGGASEAASSFSLLPERNFFMHVNAEVIFYGGTDPRAKLTIDGNPVALAPDGTFRYHCIFPNAEYRIPIVAQSPDGAESRSAHLVFQRETGKVGIVTDTPQPPFDQPFGRVQ